MRVCVCERERGKERLTEVGKEREGERRRGNNKMEQGINNESEKWVYGDS